MNGSGILKGLWVTFKHLADTYIEDWKAGQQRYNNPEGIELRRRSDTKGIFTVQYPEEKLPIPEEFRFLPFLVYDEGQNGEQMIRCTSCGICAKVCPPQCIWITRTNDPVTGKPVPIPADFFIDADICMNCGFCAEYCPFDAIKMDHNFELATQDRMQDHIFNKEKLLKSASYYASIRPVHSAIEQAAKAEKEAAKANRPAKAA
jgi:NADH-quinone oxidoreductase subunit I